MVDIIRPPTPELPSCLVAQAVLQVIDKYAATSVSGEDSDILYGRMEGIHEVLDSLRRALGDIMLRAL